jgi:hypothetical protein
LLGALIAPIVKALDPKSGSESDYGITTKWASRNSLLFILQPLAY